MEYETFYATIMDHNGTMRITVPNKLTEFAGIKVGDAVKVLIQKANKEE